MNISTFRAGCGDQCTETEFLESMSLCAVFVGIKLKVSAVSPYLCVCSHWSARGLARYRVHAYLRSEMLELIYTQRCIT